MASGPISYRDFSRNGPPDPTPLCVTARVIGINMNRKCLWEGFGGKNKRPGSVDKPMFLSPFCTHVSSSKLV